MSLLYPNVSGGGSGSGSNIFVYREGEPSPSGSVFAHFDAAHAAALASKVPARLVVDDSIGECSVNVVKDYDLSQVRLAGLRLTDEDDDYNTLLIVPAGVTFNEGICGVDSLFLDYQGDTPLCTSSAPYLLIVVENGATVNCDGAGPIFDVSQGDDGTTLVCDMRNGSSVNASFVNAGGNNSQITFYVGDNCTLASNAVLGTSGRVYSVVTSPSANVPRPTDVSSFFTGSFRPQFLVQAQNITPWRGGNLPSDSDSPILQQGGGHIFFKNGNTPYYWNSSSWVKFPEAYEPEYLSMTLSTPQVTGLTTGGKILFDTVLASRANSFVVYSVPGTFFLNFNAPPDVNVSYKLTGNPGSLFDGAIAYQWWDVTNNVGLGNVSGNIGSGIPGDAVALVQSDYGQGQGVAIQVELRLTFVAGTTFIGENTAGGFILPWATVEAFGLPT